MKKSAHIADGQVGERSDYFLTSLVDFCVDSVNTCLSRDADTLCVPVGLTFLSALLLLLSCLLFVYQRCKIRGENPGETAVFFYCFIGNLCSTTGAILSRQLHIQVTQFYVGPIEMLSNCNCPLWCPLSEKRLRMMKRRRRQHLLAVCVLMVVAGGFLKSRVSHTSALQPDNTEIVGYLLGLLSFVIACTSRIPKLCRCNGHKVTHTAIFSGLLCSLAGALYTAAILLCDTQFRFLMRAMPWLLSSAGCVTLDLLVSLHSKCDHASLKLLSKESVTSPRGDVGSEPPSRRVGAIRADGFCSTDTSCESSPVSSDLEVNWTTWIQSLKLRNESNVSLNKHFSPSL
uniref:Transmembrane protein 44 n=1 Tax=Pundamilia nyererei TaxID=303518 RepID=A0A3B4H1W6_9CICH